LRTREFVRENDRNKEISNLLRIRPQHFRFGGNYLAVNMSDIEILTADGSSAESALDWPALLARHQRWLRTAVFARLRELEGVDDVMQAVAVAALRQQAPLLDFSKAAPWLYRLAIWQTLQYRRRAGRVRKLTENYALAAGHHQESVDPLAWLLMDERRELTRAALERLPRQDAEILLLKYTENWSYNELAEHLGISASAVQTRLHRARGRMRRELAALNMTGEER
jgi:RNA polymerase sigma-70 factor (ECF subfamily)